MEMQENVIEKLLNKFDDSTTNLNDIIATLCDEQECFEAVVETIQMEIEDLKTLLNDFDFFVKTQREANMKCRLLHDQFEHCKTSAKIIKDKIADSGIEGVAIQPVQQSWVSVDHSATQPSSLSFNKQDRAEIPIKPKGPTKVEVPSVNSINEDMLKHIPGYMKGRLKASNVNEFISKFNATVQEKYKLLRKARNSLSSQEKQLVQNFKLQETKLTKGIYFCTGDDLKEFSNLKYSNSSNTIVNVLRHLGLIKEIREAKQPVKYGVVQLNSSN